MLKFLLQIKGCKLHSRYFVGKPAYLSYVNS